MSTSWSCTTSRSSCAPTATGTCAAPKRSCAGAIRGSGCSIPGEFLPLAEQSGLIVDVTDFVLTDAIRQIGHWRQRGLNLAAAVNLSPRFVQDLEFPDRLTRIFREFDVTPEQLTLEVTEAASLDDPDLVMDIFTRLRVKGVGLSLDDFGTGTSSLTQLYKMPFSEVKIDGSLICEVATSKAGCDRRARHRRARAQPVADRVRRGCGDFAGVRIPGSDRLRRVAGRLHRARRCPPRKSKRSSTCGTAATRRSCRWCRK